MNKRESEFLQRLRATFLVEAREHLQAIASGLVALEKAGSVSERSHQLEIVFRHTHSLKGASRAANFPRIEAVCQGIEEVFALCKRRGRILTAADFDTLHRAFDLVGAYVDAGGVAPDGASTQEASDLVGQLQAMASGEHAAEREPAPPPGLEPSASAGERRSLQQVGRQHPPAGAAPTEPIAPAATAPATIRIAAPHLDRVLLAAEELLTIKQGNAERADELRRLERGFDDWGKQWLAAQTPLRRVRALSTQLRAGPDPASAEAPYRVLEYVDWTFGYIKSLEGRLRAVAKSAARDEHITGKQIDELLDESKNLLMTPFGALTELMPKLVRDLARDQGKQVDLQLGGAEVQLDKRMLEQLKDPLVHLVRNAIDHGVASPARRSAAGLAGAATLRIEARLVHGNKIEMVVADDGAGFDPQQLRKAAVDCGLIEEDAARQLDDGQAVELAFRSDVSTSPIITEISGRGLGLAIVRERVEKLGGRIQVENRLPLGACFRITLPQSLATFRGVFVQAGGQVFIIPTTHVERVARLPRTGLKTVSRRETLSIDGQAVAVAHLHDVLELPPPATGPTSGFITVVLVGGGHERLALAVDEVLHDEEVLVKRLQRPLVRVRNIAGATVLASGKVLPILNVADVLKSARHAGDSRQEAPAPSGDARTLARTSGRRILLAEDSITSRLLLKGILEGAGCEVKTVGDGIEAFTALRSEPFDLLVSDIEMPRLNGFDLTARIRADRTLGQLPVVLVTALARREDRERGIDVGANAYITKGGFDQRDLLAAVARLVGIRDRQEERS
ncbi:MAG: response regulator [Proteobacteria bacterium]|nr:response regulator [Pseudomonadota bacterium]